MALPRVQLVHVVDDTTGANVPAAHSAQALAPAPFVNEPTGHDAHATWLVAAAYEPAVQSVHTVMPVEGCIVP